EDGDTRPHRHDVRDLFLADLGLLGVGLVLTPVLLELTLLLRQLALLVAQRRGLLEFLVLDRVFLVLTDLLDLLLELALARRRARGTCGTRPASSRRSSAARRVQGRASGSTQRRSHLPPHRRRRGYEARR